MDDVLVIGEALVDIVHDPSGARTEHPGGSPANVALGLARLDLATALLTRLGDDERGARVRTHLTSSGVRLVCEPVAGARTSTATAVVDERGVARYEFDLDWQLPTQIVPEPAAAVHTGSIAAFLSPGGDQVLDLLARLAEYSTISYDPNARPRLMGDPARARSRVERIVSASDVVKVSDEDLAWLAPGEDPARIADEWLERGPSLVVVTLGERGALGVCRAGRMHAPAPTIEVVDTVGAGDAFTAGMLDRLAGEGLLGAERREALRDLDLAGLRDLLRHAVLISAVTCTRAGARPPTRAELTAWTQQPGR